MGQRENEFHFIAPFPTSFVLSFPILNCSVVLVRSISILFSRRSYFHHDIHFIHNKHTHRQLITAFIIN